MDPVIARFQRAVNCFDGPMHSHLSAVPSEVDAWALPTPCSEWDVRALVNHIVNELSWMPPLVEGKTIADVGSSLDGDLLGDDPIGVFHHAASLAHGALEEPGALDRTVQLSFGEMSARDYAEQVTGDILIHSWDLATAVGADDTLPEDLVAWAGTWVEEVAAQFGQYGVYAPRVEVAPDADEQTRVLAALGRAR